MVPSASPPEGLDAIEAEHVDIAETLRAHQEALVRAAGDAEAAEEALQLFRTLDAMLRAHIRLEDERLIPVFAERVRPAPNGCSPEILLAEHRKLERLLTTVEDALEAVVRPQQPVPASSVLELIELERSIREVLEHHDQRERAAFFPALRACLSPSERQELLT